MGGLDGRDSRALMAMAIIHELTTDRLNIEQIKLVTELFDVLGGIEEMKPTMVFSITIEGVAQPAGSKQAFVPTNKKTGQPYRDAHGRIIVNVVDDNPKSNGWKKHVATMAQRAWGCKPLLNGPLFVQIIFYRERIDGHFGSGRNSVQIKQSADAFPQTRPDVLKLARGVEDALTNVIWGDDSRIVDEVLSKRYGSPARVEIHVGTLPATVGEVTQGSLPL